MRCRSYLTESSLFHLGQRANDRLSIPVRTEIRRCRLIALPSEIFREHVYVSPFYEPHYESPVKELVDLVGIERLVFGSDWPHGEGKVAPLDYMEDVSELSDDELRRFMRSNAADLLGLDG